MSITAHRMTGGDTGIKERLQMLAPSLAALLYPFALEGFNASVTRMVEGGAGALGLSWLGAVASADLSPVCCAILRLQHFHSATDPARMSDAVQRSRGRTFPQKPMSATVRACRRAQGWQRPHRSRR